MEYKSISSKLPIDELTRFKDYCKRKGTTPSNLIRELIKKEIEVPIPHSVAGKNKIKYNKERDNFTWSVVLDTGDESEVLSNVSPEFLEDLLNMVDMSLEERFTFLSKIKKDSVAVPSNILRLRNE